MPLTLQIELKRHDHTLSEKETQGMVEAVVGRLKAEKNGSRGEAKAAVELSSSPNSLRKQVRSSDSTASRRVLVTEGKPEPLLAFELPETRTDNWLTSGWSLDAMTTSERGAFGIAKDLYKGAGLERELLTWAGMRLACLRRRQGGGEDRQGRARDGQGPAQDRGGDLPCRPQGLALSQVRPNTARALLRQNLGPLGAFGGNVDRRTA